MTPRKEFRPLQAEEIARAFQAEGVDYLFIGRRGGLGVSGAYHVALMGLSEVVGECDGYKHGAPPELSPGRPRCSGR